MTSALKAFTILFMFVVLAADKGEGRHHRPDCPSFSCGPLGDVSWPFRQASDSAGCGYRSYELVCSDTKATIHIDNATYYVSGINYEDSSFWVVDADLDLYNSCPLPRWNQNRHPDGSMMRTRLHGAHRTIKVELAPVAYNQANFVKCCQEVKDNGMYMPVACLSTSYSFVYVLTGQRSYFMENLEPCCSYLAMTPLDHQKTRSTETPDNASYADVVKFMTDGFRIRFPFKLHTGFMECLMDIMPTSPEDWIETILQVDILFLSCAAEGAPLPLSICLYVIQLALEYLRSIAVLCRFVLAPLVVIIFLAYKYWKTSITIDAVETFLRMQQVLENKYYNLPTSNLEGSFWWKSHLKLLDIYKSMSRCNLGNGKTVNFWIDLWE